MLRIRDTVTEQYMLGYAKHIREFDSMVAAIRFFKFSILPRVWNEEYVSVEVVDAERNLRLRIGASNRDGVLEHHPHVLLPLHYNVPSEHWRFFAEAREILPGHRLRTMHGKSVDLITIAPPRECSLDGSIFCRDEDGREDCWEPLLVGVDFKYSPPLTADNLEALRWAATEGGKTPSKLWLVEGADRWPASSAETSLIGA